MNCLGFLIRKFIEGILAMERRTKTQLSDVQLALRFSRQIPTDRIGLNFIVTDPLDYDLLHKKRFSVKLEESKADKEWKNLETQFFDSDTDMDSSSEDSSSQSPHEGLEANEEDFGDLEGSAPRQIGKVQTFEREDDSKIQESGPRRKVFKVSKENNGRKDGGIPAEKPDDLDGGDMV